jgi:predicted nucleic acid-binding protein
MGESRRRGRSHEDVLSDKPFTVDAGVWLAAFSPRDKHHFASVAFLRAALAAGHTFVAPESLVVDVVTALARKTGEATAGFAAMQRLVTNPALQLDPLTSHRAAQAAVLGAAHGLRASDAFYVATADALDAPIVSWEPELGVRGGAITPAQYLDQGAQGQLAI